jgi:hypothetical protein
MTPLIPRKVHSFRNYNGGAGVGVYRGGISRKTRIAHVASARDTAKHGSPRDSIPSPWGSRSEFVFREIGGFIWL